MKRAVWLLLVVTTAACGSKTNGGSGDGGTGSGTDAAPLQPDAFAGPWSDFPSQPIVDGTAPATSGTLFGDPTTGTHSGGPCMVEPDIGTLFPNNWLRPRFTWVPTGGENLFEIRMTTANETNPLVVYTQATTWTMPADLWMNLSTHIVDQDINLTVRGATYDAGTGTISAGGPELGSGGPIRIAPVAAPGAIVYWTTTGGTKLRGFHIGDETVTDLVGPADNGTGTQCVGCHSSTPDGAYVGFSASVQSGNGDPAMLGVRSTDGQHSPLPFLTASAQTLMARQYQEVPVFSKNHWRDGDHVAVSMFAPTGGDATEIMWTDLEAASTTQDMGWGVLKRTGDAKYAGDASFAHNDDTILYVSATSVHAGITVTDGDLRTVPYANRAGGMSTTVMGADTDTYNEYYPTLSPDDKYIAYNRVAKGQSSYNNTQAEVWVIPRAGGTPTKLVANAPAVCSGQTSPGITNSWPKWAPAAGTVGTKTYYWLTFSSTRLVGHPQLYVTPVVDDGSGTLQTFPALYLWNQPAAEANHTPAWDNFSIIN